MSSRATKSLITLIIILALSVVMLGAYTRLTNAGLGCPDWPGCYGQLVLNPQPLKLPPAEVSKAWTEMAHRYCAAALVLLISALILKLNLSSSNQPLIRKLSLFLLVLMAFQATLGMWTVTLKLLPLVVMGHLLGGMLILATLVYLGAELSHLQPQNLGAMRLACNLGLIILGTQIALGGWVSANYAGIACIGFPQCNGHWLVHMDWVHAFNLFSSHTLNYQGGVLDNSARVTIQIVHRIGALITLLYLLTLSALLLFKTTYKPLRCFAVSLVVLILAQCGLGIANVVYFLPLPVAVLHNGTAALLLANLVILRYLTSIGTES